MGLGRRREDRTVLRLVRIGASGGDGREGGENQTANIMAESAEETGGTDPTVEE